MLPDWIVKILESMGIAGAIIFILLTTVVALVLYIKSMQARADKIYGYRLAERDNLNKALTDSSKVLEDVLRATEDRNELTAEQAELLVKQSQAFELLKVTILSQYDNIRDHHQTNAQVVSAMSEAVRVLSSMVVENRTIAQGHVNDVKALMQNELAAVRESIRRTSQAQIAEMRDLLGQVTVVRRRKSP
jgi:hypothetical protein